MTRYTAIILVGVFGVLLAGSAAAQTPDATKGGATNFKGLSAPDLKNYCIFNDKIYSVGARFCITRIAVMVCIVSNDGTRAWVYTGDNNCGGNPYVGAQ
jgi:hypothetical protein